ncbi:hypothetical protein CYMTET_37204 [Cymbomonas tetramitiformis]|uniref:Uncharacterized protein n=1 Tax=Cymbomonas tetramitiformis TaxID=36881 RepID=A0AAE0CFV2_9CHLO|nr:hypothetical protein CYMTET_37204 [Cymbomonas tetramitiformis]
MSCGVGAVVGAAVGLREAERQAKCELGIWRSALRMTQIAAAAMVPSKSMAASASRSRALIIGWVPGCAVLSLVVYGAEAAVVAGKAAMRMTRKATKTVRVGGESRRMPACDEPAPRPGTGWCASLVV